MKKRMIIAAIALVFIIVSAPCFIMGSDSDVYATGETCDKTDGTCGHVAHVGDKGYNSIDSALSAWESDGGTLKLLKDVEPSDRIVLKKAATLDLNGHTLDMGAEDFYFNKSGETLTISDSSTDPDKKGKITSTKSGATSGTLRIANGSLSLEGGIVENTISTNNALYVNKPDCVMKGGAIFGNMVIRQPMTIENGDLSNAKIILRNVETAKVTIYDVVTVPSGDGWISAYDEGYMIGSEIGVGSTTYEEVVDHSNSGALITTEGGNTTGYPTFDDAIAAAVDDDTIVLNKDAKSQIGSFGNVGTTITIDLAGHKLEFEYDGKRDISVSNDVIIEDSTKEGIMEFTTGIFTLCRSFSIESGGKLTIGEGIAVLQEPNPHSLVYIKPGATLEVKPGASLTSGSENGTIFIGEQGESSAEIAKLVLEGSVVNSSIYYAITGNGLDSNGGTEIIISGNASVESDKTTTAIYHPQAGILTVKDDATIEGGVGIQMCYGTLNISGNPMITANGVSDYQDKGDEDGTIDDGAAISIVNRSYPGGIPSANISGMPIITANSNEKAIAVYIWNKADSTQEPWTDANIVVTGGTFSSILDASYIHEGYCAGPDGSNYIVAQHVEQTLPAVAATCTDTGLTVGSECPRCGVGTAQTVVDALGHDMKDIEGTSDKKCSRCNHVELEGGIEAEMTTDTGDSSTVVKLESTDVITSSVTDSSGTTITSVLSGVSDQSISTALAHTSNLGSAAADAPVEIIVNTGSSVAPVQISSTSIQSIADSGATLTIKNEDAEVSLDNTTLKNLPAGGIEIDVKETPVTSLTSAQQNVVKDNFVVSIEVTVNGAYVDELGGYAYIKIPLTPETADHDVYFVDTDGSLTKMKEIERTATYIIVETDHFSEYVLMSASSVPSIPPIFIPMPDDDDFIPPVQAVKEDDRSTEIACIAAGAVAAMLAAILVATSRGRL